MSSPDPISHFYPISIFEYHLRRNRAAHQSHRKSWLRKHKRRKLKTLL